MYLYAEIFDTDINWNNDTDRVFTLRIRTVVCFFFYLFVPRADYNSAEAQKKLPDARKFQGFRWIMNLWIIDKKKKKI